MRPLGWWLMLVSCLRLSSVWFGFFDIWALRAVVFPDMTDIHGRTFAIWTLLTCTLAALTAATLSTATDKGLYTATLLSFVYALAHFLVEHFVFGTMPLRGLATTAFFAGTSIVWMLKDWRSVGAPPPLTTKQA